MAQRITINPIDCDNDDADLVSRLACEVIAQKNGHLVESLWWRIEVTYEPDEESDSELASEED